MSGFVFGRASLLSDKLNASMRFVGHYICSVFVCPGTDMSATVRPIGVKFCIMVELHPWRVFSAFWCDIFMGLQVRVKNGSFGQSVFGVSSSLCVINEIHWCVAVHASVDLVKDVDIETVACVHNLQYRFSTDCLWRARRWQCWCQTYDDARSYRSLFCHTPPAF